MFVGNIELIMKFCLESNKSNSHRNKDLLEKIPWVVFLLYMIVLFRHSLFIIIIKPYLRPTALNFFANADAFFNAHPPTCLSNLDLLMST